MVTANAGLSSVRYAEYAFNFVDYLWSEHTKEEVLSLIRDLIVTLGVLVQQIALMPITITIVNCLRSFARLARTNTTGLGGQQLSRLPGLMLSSSWYPPFSRILVATSNPHWLVLCVGR